METEKAGAACFFNPQSGFDLPIPDRISFQPEKIALRLHPASPPPEAISRHLHRILMFPQKKILRLRRIFAFLHKIRLLPYKIAMFLHRISLRLQAIFMRLHRIFMFPHKISLRLHRISAQPQADLLKTNELRINANRCEIQPEYRAFAPSGASSAVIQSPFLGSIAPPPPRVLPITAVKIRKELFMP